MNFSLVLNIDSNNQCQLYSNSNMKPSGSKSQLIATKAKIASAQKQDSSNSTNRQKTQTKSVLTNKDSKAKLTNKSKEQEEVSAVKKQQLFEIIQTFYSTLCDLPLQKLINSGEPGLWIGQQQITISQLNKKLGKFANDNHFEYYKWKLNSVESILSNIKQNMDMMARINHLKSYYSGNDSSNYRSRASSSCESEHREIRLRDLANMQQKSVQELLSYDQYAIKQEKMFHENPSLQIQAQTVNSDSQQSQQSMEKFEFLGKSKDMKRQRLVPKEGENRNISNKFNQNNVKKPSLTYNMKEMKDKTLTKIQNTKTTNSQRTLSNLTQGRFLEDKIMNAVPKKYQYTQNCQRENSNSIYHSSKIQGTTMEDTLKESRNALEYIQMIKQLRLDLQSKDKEIERLLINQQQYDEGIEIMKECEKNKSTEIMFLKQSVSNGNRQKEKLQLEIKRLLEFQEELKDTVRFERERNKKEEKEKEKLQERYEVQADQRQQLQQEIKKLNEQKKEMNKAMRVMKQKLQVYSKKYFRLYEQANTYKESEKKLMLQICELKNGDSPQDRYEKIRDLIDYHKNLIADDSQF